MRELSSEEISEVSGGYRWLLEAIAGNAVYDMLKGVWESRNTGAPDPNSPYHDPLGGYHGA